MPGGLGGSLFPISLSPELRWPGRQLSFVLERLLGTWYHEVARMRRMSAKENALLVLFVAGCLRCSCAECASVSLRAKSVVKVCLIALTGRKGGG